MRGDTGDDGTIVVRAAALRAELWRALVGAAAFAACSAFFGWRFWGVVEPVLLLPWLALMWTAPLGTAALAVLYFVRRPDDAVQIRRYRPVGRALLMIANLAAVVSPWILLPHADGALRAVLLMLYIWFLATEAFMVHSGRHTWVALVGVPLSLATYFLGRQLPDAPLLTIFVMLAGATLFGLDWLLRRNRLEAQDALLASVGEAATLCARLTDRDAQPLVAAHRDPLTPRQTEVARLLAEGLSNKQIAQRLAVSPATVKAHVAQVIAVTGARGRDEASARARALGLP